jgi:GNAT superfamily N-acetyltransferase
MRAARVTDLPALAEQRERAGWGAQAWALRAVLEPPDARSVVVEDGRGTIAGVGSGIAYGPLGVVGNMIVVESHRRRGVGTAILETVIDFLAEERGCSRLELYATASGRPLYAKHGFVTIEPGSRVQLPRLEGSDDVDVEAEGPGSIGAVTSYDAPRFGADRGRLLATMAADPDRPLLVARRSGQIVGYAWLRPEDGRLGPFVADSPSVAACIVSAAYRAAASDAGLSINLPTSNHTGMAWLASLGVEVDPWDGRMARGEPIARREDTIYGSVVGALG